MHYFKNKDTRFEFSINFSAYGHNAGVVGSLTGLEYRQSFSVLITRYQPCPLLDLTLMPVSLCHNLFALITFLLKTQLKSQ